MEIRVRGVDYEGLTANAELTASFKDGAKGAVAEAKNIPREWVAIELSAGSVVVKATITPPDEQFESLLSDVSSSSSTTAVATGVTATLAALPDIQSVSNGDIVATFVAVEEVHDEGTTTTDAMPTKLATEADSLAGVGTSDDADSLAGVLALRRVSTIFVGALALTALSQ